MCIYFVTPKLLLKTNIQTNPHKRPSSLPFCQTYITTTPQVHFQTCTVQHTIQLLTYKWEGEKKS